jgi:tripartite-type tricarboxylate transporter receptor subunit TctC
MTIAALFVALLIHAPLTLAQPQNWPTKPLRLLVPLAAGSTADIVSRVLALELGKALGQTIVVENKPGAGGTIATAETARAPADGYTLAFASQGTLIFNQGLYAKPGYDSLKDFTPLAFIGSVSNVMIVHPENPAQRPADIIASARAKPGEVSFSSGGSGTSHHLSGVLFGNMTNTSLLHVPYKGAPQGILAVMSKEVSVGFFNTPTVIAQIKDGRLKPLGVTSLKRSPLLPQVATLDEQGVRGYEVNAWFGVIAPTGLPANLVTRLNGEINKILALPEVREKLGAQGFELAPAMESAAFSQLIADDYAKWLPIVKASGAKAD